MRGIKENHCIITDNFIHWHQTQLHGLVSLVWKRAFHCLLPALASLLTTFPCTVCELEAFLSWGFSMHLLLSTPVSRHCVYPFRPSVLCRQGWAPPSDKEVTEHEHEVFGTKGCRRTERRHCVESLPGGWGSGMSSGLPRALLRKGRDPTHCPASYLLPTASPPGRARSSVATPSCRGSRST